MKKIIKIGNDKLEDRDALLDLMGKAIEGKDLVRDVLHMFEVAGDDAMITADVGKTAIRKLDELSNILYQLEKGCYDMAQKEEKESWEKQE
jgi:hypothetical protein